MAGHEVVETYVEVESGKRSDRPELARALAKCKLVCATLVVAKLDRLARDLAFVACLMRDKIPFVACDNPHATELTIGILAAIAQHEAKMISDRTKAALAAAKARGVTLGGNHTFTAAERAKGRAIGSTTIAAKFNHRAEAVAPIIKELRQSGATTLLPSRPNRPTDCASSGGSSNGWNGPSSAPPLTFATSGFGHQTAVRVCALSTPGFRR
jgi:DNA invertase Pin-like site-specific DNA recombinase